MEALDPEPQVLDVEREELRWLHAAGCERG